MFKNIVLYKIYPLKLEKTQDVAIMQEYPGILRQGALQDNKKH